MILDLKRLPILETERLRLEPLVAADATHLYPIMGDPEVMAYWDVPEIDDPDVVAEVVQGQVEGMADGRAVYWAMRTLGDQAFVGSCDLSEIDRRHRRAEVGFMLGREAWGQGYALEAVRTVIAFAAGGGLRKLTARTHLGNRRSEVLLAKLGFTEEGLLRGHVFKDGERRDCRVFGLLL
ncbi:MAG: GNAT family N-acetyltransferase [Alphaproteobacteria bacterium]|nr:GNAT family N-acetyltransferase [Alphaproteobacteria bacterium]MBU1513766.1 GNAT family N-acetyltransferase [Alphaproteobacteria bacterium]MBU2094589.1 GNAT family N-acetyltransferase [Alphaproteobacteria bacterium]MBU2149652.1 GNAT family N-acetyltransferase [Alphaproteobacteria bacterium]MBU2309129.1 GNAT family N-acetyltransferase [Alphaproteobacteria bacterium]